MDDISRDYNDSFRYDDEARPYVESFSEKLHQITVDYNLAEWQLYAYGDGSLIDNAIAEKSLLLSDQDLYKKTSKWAGNILDPLLAKQVDILCSMATKYHEVGDMLKKVEKKEKKLTESLSNYRVTYQGKQVTDSELSLILETETDPKLRENAWNALHSKGTFFEPQFLELVKMRNNLAHSLGYANFFAMQLDTQNIDTDQLDYVLESLEQVSTPIYSQFMEKEKQKFTDYFGLSPEEIRPWHFGLKIDNTSIDVDDFFPKEKQMLFLKSTFKDMGFDLDKMNFIFDLEPRDGKTQGAYCFGIDVPSDVRVLANENSGLLFQRILEHETMHAVYKKGVDSNLPFLLKNCASAALNEGVALVMDIICNSKEWLEKYAYLPKDLAMKTEDNHKRDAQTFVRSYLRYIEFEKNLYQDPEQDLSGLWWDLNEKYMGIPKPDDTSLADWADVTDYISSPVYKPNYILAQVIAAQLHNILVSRNDSIIGNENTAKFFNNELFKAGATLDEKELLLQVTGEELNPSYYINNVFR